MLSRLPANRFMRHLLFWVFVCVFLIGVDRADSRFYTDPNPFYFTEFFCIFLPILLVYAYTLAYWLLPFVLRRQLVWFSSGLFVLNLLTWVLANVLNGILHYLAIPLLANQPKEFILREVTNWRIFDPYFLNGPLFTVNLVAGFLVGTKLFIQWYQKQQENQRLEREKLTQELALLKLQLNPDFLFGTLSTLYTLTKQQSTLAPEVVINLAHFLRYVLYESQAEAVPLDRELDVISDYVFLQRIIRPKLVEVSFTIRGTITNQHIAPLSLFPVIENTFRQVSAELTEPTWVSIDLAVTDTQVTLKVINELVYPLDYDNNSLANLDGLQKQLAFYYPGDHSLKIWQEDQINVVTLSISFPTNSVETSSLPTQPIGSPI